MVQTMGTSAAPSAEAAAKQSEVEPSQDQIRSRAYEIYLSRSAAPGNDLDDWLQAERELRSQS